MSSEVGPGDVSSDDLGGSKVQPPEAASWNTEQVADWIEALGYPQYRECFVSNSVDGRRLVMVTASALPRMGITDFLHIKHIASSLRRLLGVEEEQWGVSISKPPRDKLGLYLEQKSRVGKKCDALNYEDFLYEFEDMKWKPPLSNQCLLLPSE